MAVLAYGHVASFYRIGLVFIAICTGWLWMGGMSSSPNLRFKIPGHPHPPPSFSSSRLSVSTNKLGDVLFPVPLSTGASPWVRDNHLMFQSLFDCLESFDCHANQTKIVLLASMHFRFVLLGGVGGEQIWAKSTIDALQNLGYTYFYTSSPGQTMQLYQMFPGLVKAVLVDDEEAERCFHDTEGCTFSEEKNPTGIPPWKVFSFAFWSNPANPLGHQWTLAPENYERIGLGHNTYLGYSIEFACRAQPFIPHSKRENQAYILAKLLSFFTPQRDRAWSPAIFDAATTATGIQYMIGATNDTLQGEWPAAELPSNYIGFGRIGQSVFFDKLSRARVLIGMGNPFTSPTPYDALCLGVPFINPVLQWDKENPSDKSQWVSQHSLLELLEPPYVYNVFKDDLEGFVKAIQDAISHPIQSFVPEQMRMPSIERRLGAILEKDWQREAALQTLLKQERG
ncbi:hypothetical protein PILCRDRAFT_823456 [Piloderma croceum F 1598]|uniref:Glycosyltransferase family 18 catalytic domain-containing protein n=1 Tax=Piloderma croceum (strain F 1598) TaxID=765440 RepID=A0A0C3FIF2_PILCF|nr:hypothetical protein PILCRDRAFT_823456 [Piloderma croceum F 1598]